VRTDAPSLELRTDTPTANVRARQTRHKRPRWRRRLLVVYGFVLATVAVVALAVAALALHSGAAAQQDIRDEERQQTMCQRALVVAQGVSPQQKQLVDALNACYGSDGTRAVSSSNP
jgi:hypothetical protein